MALIPLLGLLAIIAIALLVGWFLLNKMNLPEPIRTIVLIVLVILVAIVAIVFIADLTGVGTTVRLR